jgi:hypothetical protein
MMDAGVGRAYMGTNAERLAWAGELPMHKGRVFIETDSEMVYRCDGSVWVQIYPPIVSHIVVNDGSVVCSVGEVVTNWP